MTRRIALLGALALTGLGAQAQTQAPSYPNRPITLVVPSSPAGSTDLCARLVGDGLAKSLGQAVVVDNRPGASGNLGTEAVARAKPDGYTLLMQYSGYHIGNPLVLSTTKWNPTKDFVPVALVMRAPHLIVVGPSVRADNLKALIAQAKTSAGGKGIFYASSGAGSIQHIAGELFGQMTKVPMTHVPYKGAAPAINDLIGGQVDLFVTTPPSVIGHVNVGKLKALAYTGRQRHPSMPQVPTSAEAGLPGYEIESWFAVFAPAGTPAPVVAKLSSEIKKIVESEAYRKKMDEQGAFAAYMDSPTLARFVDTELASWGKVVKAAGIKAD